jgi:hypothetical protein
MATWASAHSLRAGAVLLCLRGLTPTEEPKGYRLMQAFTDVGTRIPWAQLTRRVRYIAIARRDRAFTTPYQYCCVGRRTTCNESRRSPSTSRTALAAPGLSAPPNPYAGGDRVDPRQPLGLTVWIGTAQRSACVWAQIKEVFCFHVFQSPIITTY